MSARGHGISGTDKEVKDGIQWLATAGVLALVLSLCLFYVDDHLTSNTKSWEHAKSERIRELRLAQSGLASRVSDTRQTR